jgi:hypothetical protein
MKEAMVAFERASSERAVSAMPVAVHYVARIGRVELAKCRDDYEFRITRTFEDGRKGEQWSDQSLNVFTVRDEFLKVKTPGEALDFLTATGEFYPLNDTIRWSEFKLWQRFTHLVQEHNELASAMKCGDRSGEHTEALKALTGIYPSRFFELPHNAESDLDKQWRNDPEIGEMIREGEALEVKCRRDLCAWFHNPAGEACSIEWIPKEGEINEDLTRKLQSGRAMIEFLLPREELRPVLVIRTRYTLQAIAAAIYADRIQGVEYRTCSVCNALFKVGAHKNKKYCDRERCKNTAHQRRRRAVPTKKNQITKTRKTRKGGQK